MMDDPIKQIEAFLNEQRADILTLDIVVKCLITRLAPREDFPEVLSALEQQSLHSALVYGPEGQSILEPRIQAFFQALRDWQASEKTSFPSSSSSLN